MATSSVPRVKARLLTTMQTALAALHTRGAVTWAHPGADVRKEAVFMGDARFSSESPSALRASPRQQDEFYTIPVFVDVMAEGNDPQGAEERAYVLAGSVEDAIRTDQTLGALTWTGGTLFYAQVDGKEPLGYQTDQGRVYAVVLNIKVHARI